MRDAIESIKESVKTRFEESKRVLSFEEFLALCERDPYGTVRSAAHYLHDALGHFGSHDIDLRGHKVQRWRVFDQAFSDNPRPVAGQEQVQSHLFQNLTSFVRNGRMDKLILLHGPNGSAKSSIVRALGEGLEAYSRSSEGMLYSFSWIFPTEAVTKGGLGIGVQRGETAASGSESFAKLEQDRIAAIVRSELHENPIYLVPREERADFFERWLKSTRDADKRGRLETLRDGFMRAELSHKSGLIYEALLDDYRGDYRKVLRHVRVERLFLSRLFRKGLVTIGPQFGVDATIRQVTLDRSVGNLPPALQSLNLFQLEGDLIDGNRGVIEFDDFLKRPVEHFKYLLGTCETGLINLSHIMASLDATILATTNDRQLEAFREHPEFNSFRARIEFIKVPYLLRYSDEEKIYSETAARSRGDKELMPHTTKVLALWAVLTRLKPPMTKNKNAVLTRVLERLSPLEKARLYDSGELPQKLSDEERRELKGHVEDLVAEHQSQPYYEGLFGASARELKVVLQLAAQNDQFPTLGPNAVLSELQQLVKRHRDYEYLRQEAVQGYFAFEDMIVMVRQEWLDWVDREVRVALGLQDEAKMLDSLQRYFSQVTHYVRGEKVRNRVTGQMEEADDTVMSEFEKYIDVTGNVEEYRKNLITRLAAWSLENPGRDMAKGLPLQSIFPDLMDKLHNRAYGQQSSKLHAMGAFIMDIPSFDAAAMAPDTQNLSEPARLAVRAYTELQKRFGYGVNGAREALLELVRARYVS